MKSEDSDTAAGASANPEPEKQVEEQKSSSYQDELLKVAQAEGMIGDDVVAEAPPEGSDPEASYDDEPEPEEETPEPAEEEKVEEDAETEEEPAAAAKKAEEWPESAKRRVAEESDKRKRANEERDTARQRIVDLEAALAQASAPPPTSDLSDLQDEAAITRVENSYESLLRIAEKTLAEPWEDEYGEKITHKKIQIGKDKEESFTRADLVDMRINAERALRKEIPTRRTFLAVRAQEDAKAVEAYPQLVDQNSDFRREAGEIVNAILTGQARNHPQLLMWVARAVAGLQVEQSRNGKGASPTQRIVESAKTKLAPTPVKTRSFARRGSSSDMARATKELEQSKSVEAAERYVAAVRSQSSGGAKRLDRVSE